MICVDSIPNGHVVYHLDDQDQAHKLAYPLGMVQRIDETATFFPDLSGAGHAVSIRDMNLLVLFMSKVHNRSWTHIQQDGCLLVLGAPPPHATVKRPGTELRIDHVPREQIRIVI